MPEVILNGGHVMLVDEADLPLAQAYRWQSRNGYAVRIATQSGKRQCLAFHRVIMDAPAGLEVDHINGSPLDNRRENLRLVTHRENMQNLRGARSDSTTGLRGVQRLPGGTFHVKVWVADKCVSLGAYPTPEEAASVARDARLRLFAGATS